jgi:hypothetical protein
LAREELRSRVLDARLPVAAARELGRLRAVPEAAELLRADDAFELPRAAPEAAALLRAGEGFALLRDLPEGELLRAAEFALLRAAELAPLGVGEFALFALLREAEFALLRAAEFERLRAPEFEPLRAEPELRRLELAGAAPVSLGAAPAFGAALRFVSFCLATLPPDGVVPGFANTLRTV